MATGPWPKVRFFARKATTPRRYQPKGQVPAPAAKGAPTGRVSNDLPGSWHPGTRNPPGAQTRAVRASPPAGGIGPKPRGGPVDPPGPFRGQAKVTAPRGGPGGKQRVPLPGSAGHGDIGAGGGQVVGARICSPWKKFWAFAIGGRGRGTSGKKKRPYSPRPKALLSFKRFSKNQGFSGDLNRGAPGKTKGGVWWAPGGKRH